MTTSTAVSPAAPKHNDFTSGTLLVLFTVIIWGLQFPVAKAAFESVNAWHAAVFRFSIPAALLLVALLVREGGSALKTGQDTWRIVALGCLGMCGAPALIFGAVMFTRPEIAAIVVATQPLMTVLVQRLLGGKKTGIVTLLCVSVAFVGVVTVVTRWQTLVTLSTVELIAILMLIAGALCFVLYTIGCARFNHWSSLRLTTLCMVVGAAANTLLVVILVQLDILHNPSIGDWLQVKWELLFLSFIGVLGAMFTWTIGAKRIGALNAMLFINLIPVVTFAVRYWQGYRFETIELLGAAMVIAALSCQNWLMRMQQAKVKL